MSISLGRALARPRGSPLTLPVRLEVRSQREEAPTHLRWAAELAASDDPDTKKAGVDQLYAVDGSGMLDDASQVYLDAALKSAVKSLRQHVIDAGEAVEVIEADPREAMKESTVEADQDPEGSDG